MAETQFQQYIIMKPQRKHNKESSYEKTNLIDFDIYYLTH